MNKSSILFGALEERRRRYSMQRRIWVPIFCLASLCSSCGKPPASEKAVLNELSIAHPGWHLSGHFYVPWNPGSVEPKPNSDTILAAAGWSQKIKTEWQRQSIYAHGLGHFSRSIVVWKSPPLR